MTYDILLLLPMLYALWLLHNDILNDKKED